MSFLKNLFKLNNRPARIVICGNGHLPEQQSVALLYAEWLNKRKSTLGNEIDQDIAIELLGGRFFDDKMLFSEYTAISVKNEYPDFEAADSLLWLDRQTGKDMILYALWTPADAARIRSLIPHKTS